MMKTWKAGWGGIHVRRPLGSGEGTSGYVLIAVLVFLALLLPLITLVLASVSQETISSNNIIIEAKTKNSAITAVNNAVSVIIERSQVPDYIVSNLPQHRGRAIIIDDNGVARWDIDNDGAGLDGIYGTDDDWWIGPDGSRRMLGPVGDYPEYDPVPDPTEPWTYRNYKMDFRWVNWNKPTYLAENWAWFGDDNPFAYNRASGRPVYLYNQFAAIHDAGNTSGLIYPESWEGYHPYDDTPDRWILPGYYPNATVPISTDIPGAGETVESTVELYQPMTNTFDTSDQLASEVSITDEAGRLNLNIFCKKMPVWARENETVDFDLDGEYTSDFNYNEVEDELIWKWIDNPLFPDRDTVIPLGEGQGNGTDFDGDDLHEPWLGEDLQHYYADDWVDYAFRSKAMLMALPGVDEALAVSILRALNPDLSTLSPGYSPDPSGESPAPPAERRADAPNLSPNFHAYFFETNVFGQITDIVLDYTNNHVAERPDHDLDYDDVPLPLPRPFTDIKQLLDIEGMTRDKYRRLRKFVTISSYDTNVIGTEIWDAEPTSGDDDEIADMRYNINTVVEPATLVAYREEADSIWKFLENHLPETRMAKFVLPVVDRDGKTKSDTDFMDPGTHPYHLNPELTYDSLLSIVLYRNGYQSGDAYRFDPLDVDGADIRTVREGLQFGIFGLFFGGFSNSFIPAAIFQPSFIADPDEGRNVNATILPHNFDSVADLFEVPLYKFDNLAIDAMVDIPSAYVCDDGDAVGVNYLVSFSDVIGLDEYDSTTGEILPEYRVIFDWDGDGVMDVDDAELVVDMTDSDPSNDYISFRTPPPTAERPAIIGSFDRPLYDHLQSSYPGEPWNWRTNNYVTFSHTFTYNTGLGNIPDPDPSMAGQAIDTDGDGNLDFAYDAFGDPYITARVSIVKNLSPPGGPDDYSALRADTTVRVYLQHNCEAAIPLQTNILAIRTGNNTYQLLSRTAGGASPGTPTYVYNWSYAGFPSDDTIDDIVTAPGDWSDQTTAPSISIDPSTSTIGLLVYDVWGADAGAANVHGAPYSTIADFLTIGDPNYGSPSWLLPLTVPNVDSWFEPLPSPPDIFPPSAVDFDVAEVNILSSAGALFTEVAAEYPSIYDDQYSVIHAGSWGGQAPYAYSIDIVGPGGFFQSFGSGGPVNSNVFTERTDDLTTPGTYTVTLTVTDSSPVPLVSLSTTEITVAGETLNTLLNVNVPNLTVSVKLEPFEPGSPGSIRAFRGVASISGGRPNYLLRWDVRDENGAVVNQLNQAGSSPMTYTQPGDTPIFRFDPSNVSDGLYFVYSSVIDTTDLNPNNFRSTLATDVVPVLVTYADDPRVVPVLYASPPGNDYYGEVHTPDSLSAATGGPPQIGTFFISGVDSIEPRIAPNGSVIEIRGVNFDPSPENNQVTFEPGITGVALSVINDPLHPPPHPGEPQQQILYVIVPDGAISGFVTVTNNFGRSQTASNENFFMTNWSVGFDLYPVHTDTYNETIEDTYRYELDFQGDGVFDVSFETTDLELLSANRDELFHDYAADGFGNYQATLKVTNVTSQKVGVSHQLIQVRDLTDVALDREPEAEALGLSVNIIPDYTSRLPLPNSQVEIKSHISGITSGLGLGYKWNLDENSRRHAFIAENIVGGLPFFASNPTFITSDVIVDSVFDARFATPNTPVEVLIRVRYPFDLNEPAEPGLSYDAGDLSSTFTIDMDEGVPFDVRGVVVERGQNYSVEEVRFDYKFSVSDSPGSSHVPTFTAVTPWGAVMPGPNPGNVFPMPWIRISAYLGNLKLSPQDPFVPSVFDGLHHQIGLTVVFDRIKYGEANTVQASDAITLPVVQQSSANVHSYLAFNPSYSLSYGQGAVEFQMAGILGGSPTLDYKSDINSDGVVDIGGAVFPNPHSRTLPLRSTLSPMSNWPATQPLYSWHNMIPGIPGFLLGTVPVPYVSDRGVYTSWALVTETLGANYTLSNRNISVDTQEIMVGGRRDTSGGVPVPPPLAVDVFVEPLLGTTSGSYIFGSFASGSGGSYSYLWTVTWTDGVSPVPISLSDGQEVLPQSYFTPDIDALDELAAGVIPTLAGTYIIELTVTDESGVYAPVTKSREIEVRAQELSAQLFVNPPAGTIDQNLEYWVYVDGGTPPYEAKIDFGDGSPIEIRAGIVSPLTLFSHSYDAIPVGPSWYNAKIEVTDSAPLPATVGDVDDGDGSEVPDGVPNYDQDISIGDRIPLHISLMSSPVSGVGAFPIQVHYAVGGGVRGANLFGGGSDDYIVGLTLLDENGTLAGTWFGADANTFGADDMPDSSTVMGRPPVTDPPGLSSDPTTSTLNRDVPITFFVPGAGKYYLQAIVLDGDFQLAFNQIEIYSEGYIAPATYDGLGTPRVRYTLEPDDPTNPSTLVEKPLHAVRIWTDPLYEPNSGFYPDADDNDIRLFEADIQILGELFTVDPNPNFFYSGDFSPELNPLLVDRYQMSLVNDPTDQENTTDFYDTFTFGRVNINTASEEVLAAIFSNIIVERVYFDAGDAPSPEYIGFRNFEEEDESALLLPADARELARAVVDYRNSYYDSMMPEIAGYSNYASGSDGIRTSHLPVIGPWDGANPHEYDASSRDDPLPDWDDADVDNVYDNYAGNYYNLEDDAYKFYSPSDIAIVRARLSTETESEYAVYLNGVMDNDGVNAGDGFDARYYITYDEESGETIADARNRLAIIESNGQTAFGWMPNPPYQNIFDLFKILGVSVDYALLNPEPADFEIDSATGRPDYDKGGNPGDDDFGNVRTFSGPSVFMYIERWVAATGTDHAERGRYEVVTNFLADISPYITTRSYVFRIEGRGALPTTTADQGNAINTGRINRDRNVFAIVDFGPLNTQPDGGLSSFGGRIAEMRLTHKVIYWQDTRMDEVGY